MTPTERTEVREAQGREGGEARGGWARRAFGLSLAGLGTMLAYVAADLGYGVHGAAAESAGPTAGALALATLCALLAPAPAALALFLPTALTLVERTPWLARPTAPLRSRAELLRRSPQAFASTLALAATAGVTFLVWRQLALHFATRYHDASLAAAAMALAALAWLPVAALISAGLAWLLLPLGRRLGAFACVGSALALLLGAATALTLRGAAALHSLLSTLDPVRFGLAAGAAVLYAVAALGLTHVRWRAPRLGLAAVWVVVAVGLVAVGLGYGRRHDVRTLVERRSAVGLRVVRAVRDLADRDGDGFAFAFGGEDCDDSDPSVHPGAADVEGDGVDSDCYAGDGTPTLDDLGDGAYAERPAGLAARPNILLISVDALRPDHLAFHGYERETSPHLDAFLRTAVSFDHAVATSTRTLLSVPSLFTGLYPSQIHYGSEYLWPSLGAQNDLLAESLRGAGYSTSVVMGTNYLSRVRGFFDGFQHKQLAPQYHPPPGWTVDHALPELRRLAASRRPFFLWVHLFTVHEPYLRDHAPSRFGPGRMAAYDTEIRRADEQVGRLLKALDGLDGAEDTVVVLFSDHGDAFGEHGEYNHANALYEEELRSVLAIRVPGVSPRRVEQTVGLLDVMPTVLNLADVRMPRPTPALSLVRLLDGDARLDPHRPLFAELMPDGREGYDQKAIRRDGRKLIWWVRDGSYALYDVEHDPGERRDLSDQRPGLARDYLGLLRAWVAQRSLPQNRTDEIVAAARLSSVPPLTQRLDARLPGHLTLLGVDLPRSRVSIHESIALDLVYRVDQATADDLDFHVKVVGPPGYRMPVHVDAYHLPLNGRYPSTEWHAGEILRDPVRIALPRTLRHPIELKLRLEVRRRRRPIPFEDGRMEIPLGSVTVR